MFVHDGSGKISMDIPLLCALEKRDDCDFVPSLFGITLPLESIQFAIPVLLAIITLAWRFLKY